MTEKEQGNCDITCINGSLLYPVHARKPSFYIYLYQWLGPFDVVLGHSQGACLVVAMDCLKCRPGIQIQNVFSDASDHSDNIDFDIFTQLQSLDFLSTLLNAEDLNSENSEETAEEDIESSDKLALPDSALSIVIGGFVPR